VEHCTTAACVALTHYHESSGLSAKFEARI
jgi:hypothetical protein